MIDIREMTLESFLHKVRAEVNKHHHRQLISWTKQIAPLSFIHAFEGAYKTGKDRMFWTNSSKDFMIIGIGSVKKIVAKEKRFEQLHDAWDELVRFANIHNPFLKSGTGLVALGGMSFDPLREKGELWKNFPTSQLTIPEYVIVYHKGNYYLTVNRYIQGNEQVDQVIDEINRMEKVLLHPKVDDYRRRQQIVGKIEIEPDRWKKSVEKAVQEIRSDRAKKIVLAREMRITLNTVANVTDLLEKLLETQPNSYVFAFEHGDDCFIGATPERLVQVEGDQLLSTCLAGTAPRGKTKQLDEQIADDLLNDEKNRKEHDYVVQMIKRSIEHYCTDIEIPKEPIVYPLRNLQHLYTPVTATLKPSYTVFDIVRELHPTPALGGVPRQKALAFIREEELLDRGWYGAPIGWIDSNANSEFAVAIRSGLIQKNEVSLFAGCGVMGDSNPEMEYEETNVKFLPLLTILEENNESY